jgi:uncharacterized protein YjdB
MRLPTPARPTALLFAFTIIAGCINSSDSSTGVSANAVATVTVAPSAVTIPIAGTSQLTATALNASGGVVSGKTFTWTTDNSSVARVDNGLVTAVSPGSTTIDAAVDGKSGSAAVTVTPR